MLAQPQLHSWGHRGELPWSGMCWELQGAWGGVLGEAAKGGGFGKGGPERAPWCCGAQHPFCQVSLVLGEPCWPLPVRPVPRGTLAGHGEAASTLQPVAC